MYNRAIIDAETVLAKTARFLAHDNGDMVPKHMLESIYSSLAAVLDEYADLAVDHEEEVYLMESGDDEDGIEDETLYSSH